LRGAVGFVRLFNRAPCALVKALPRFSRRSSRSVERSNSRTPSLSSSCATVFDTAGWPMSACAPRRRKNQPQTTLTKVFHRTQTIHDLFLPELMISPTNRYAPLLQVRHYGPWALAIHFIRSRNISHDDQPYFAGHAYSIADMALSS